VLAWSSISSTSKELVLEARDPDPDPEINREVNVFDENGNANANDGDDEVLTTMVGGGAVAAVVEDGAAAESEGTLPYSGSPGDERFAMTTGDVEAGTGYAG
jgi:hypothetical protein